MFRVIIQTEMLTIAVTKVAEMAWTQNRFESFGRLLKVVRWKALPSN